MGHHELVSPNPLMIVPFGLLLAAIALMPLAAREWWEKHYPKVSYVLGAITLAYYLFWLDAGWRALEVGHEYVSFIALIGSLFVVSGGIQVTVKGEATPLENVAFLFVGAIVANLLGTTGASMLLIRPWIRMNKYRITAHHVVFFIFIVANVGGCLTPIGDPPLFMGYVKGIPFWWVAEHCWSMWLMGVGLLLTIFYFIDLRNYRKAPKEIREAVAEPPDVFRVRGITNALFLAAILGAVFITKPLFLREAIMIGAAAASYFLTPKSIHEANHFNFEPIREVAILFIGIFATMMPALDYLQLHAGEAGRPTVDFFYWATGLLSGVLDNTPTYLTFLSAQMGALVPAHAVEQIQALLGQGTTNLVALAAAQPADVAHTLQALARMAPPGLASGNVSPDHLRIAYLLGNHELNKFVVAVSVSSVFFGAATYIGNGPNFMVKSIAEQRKIHVPSFLGYVFRFTLPCLLPMLLIVWWVFFRA